MFLWPLSPQLQQMKETRRLYPDKSVYTQQIGPGLCFGALALMLRFFFEVPGGGLGSSPPTRAPVSRSAPACLAGCRTGPRPSRGLQQRPTRAPPSSHGLVLP